MSNDQQNLIDAYLNNELTEEMRQRFEKMLATDKVFEEEFIFQQSLAETAALDSVREAMEQVRMENLLDDTTILPEFKMVQNTIKTAKAKNIKRKQQNVVKIWLIRGAVAACILLTGLWVGWANHLENDVNKELAEVFDVAAIQDSDINEEIKRSGLRSMEPTKIADREAIIKEELDKIEIALSEKHSGEALEMINNLQTQFEYESQRLDNYKKEIIEHKLSEIQTAHREKRFDEAIELLKNLQSQLPHGTAQPALKYYEANLYAQTANYDESIKILRRLTRQKSDIQHDARWLLGLLYLKTNEKAKAKKEFETLTQQSEQYKDKALQKLRKHFIL